MTIHKRLTLIRRWHESERTIGQFLYGGEPVCFTMEPGEHEESPCVPVGFYLLERHGWDEQARFEKTWALVGLNVSHWSEAGIDRSAIVIHPGNMDKESRGCIMPGLTIGHSGNEPAMIASGEAMDRIRRIIGEQDALLTICRG